MQKQTLYEIAELTQNNAHGQARQLIAQQYPYLTRYEAILGHINAIHELEGSMPFSLVNYQQEISHAMLDEIQKHEGSDVLEEIMNVI